MLLLNFFCQLYLSYTVTTVLENPCLHIFHLCIPYFYHWILVYTWHYFYSFESFDLFNNVSLLVSFAALWSEDIFTFWFWNAFWFWLTGTFILFNSIFFTMIIFLILSWFYTLSCIFLFLSVQPGFYFALLPLIVSP